MASSAIGLAAGSPVQAQLAADQPRQQPEQVIIQGQAAEDYKVDVPALSKLTEPLVDVPQTVLTIPDQVLQDRAVSDLNDALRNVPGITLGAGEFSWQGNNPSIRGFVARTDMFLDGVRDFGSYYRDPFDLERVEVLEGPSSVLFGRGSTGGVINQVSKEPESTRFENATLSFGSDLTRRITVDLNEPFDGLGTDSAFRIAGMAHAQRIAGRDTARDNRWGLAPSLAMELGAATRLTASFLHESADDVPDYGLPWFGSRPAPVPRRNFYGFETDYLRTGTDIGTLEFESEIAPSIIARNVTRYANYARDFRITEPIVTAPLGTPLTSIQVSRNIWSGTSVETMLWDQADVTAHFETGPVAHALVAGIEGGRETSKPEFDNSAGVPTVPLLAPDPRAPFSAAVTYPRLKADTVGLSFGAFVLDTLKFGEHWELSGGLRWDYFDADYRATRFSATTPFLVTGHDHLPRVDRMPSYRAALVYKPQMNGSVYLDYGTSFNPSAETLSQITSGRSLATGNAFLTPERNRTIELGTKWNLLADRLSVTGSLFRLEKLNARVADPNNPGFNMLEGTQRVDGYELSLSGRITENWQITAGYAYLDSHVVKSSPGAAPVGSPLTLTPKDSLTFWTEYRLGGGWEIGTGGQYQSRRFAQNVPPVKFVPAYWSFDAMVKYELSAKASLQLNVTNIFDTYYYEQLHPFHVVPGAGRAALLTLNFKN